MLISAAFLEYGLISEWERMRDKVRQSTTFRYVQQKQVNYVAKE